MTMPSSGPLNMGGTSTPVSVAQELGLGLTTTISMNQANVRTLAGVGGSGTTWSMSSLYGKSNRVTINIVIAANTQNYILNTAKATGYVAGITDVVLTINAGIYVGSTTTAGVGLDVNTSWAAGDKVTIINNGLIVGAGGNGGTGGNGAFGTCGLYGTNGAAGLLGGPALRCQRAVSITNNGTVGGGGGGGGGQGGDYQGFVSPSGGVGGYGGGGGRGYSGGGGGAGGGGGGGCSPAPGAAGTAGTPTAPGTIGGGNLGAAGATPATTSLGFLGGPGGAGGNCTMAGSNANITWTVTGTRLGTLA